MKETVFQREVINTLRSYGAWAYKIPDAPFMPKHIQSTHRFTPGKPCDIISFYNDIPLAIECKQFKKYEAVGKRHFRDSQLDHLGEITELKAGRAYAFINIRISKPRTNRLIIIPWKLLIDRFDNYGSIKKKILETLPYFEAKKGIFNIEKWLKTLK